MIISMTGFGKAEISDSGYHVSVEIKSVNNRFCDISIYLPQPVRSLETKLKDVVLKRIQRGKISASVRIEKQNVAEIGIDLDAKVVQSYVKLLNDLKTFAAIDETIKIEHLLNFKDIFAPKQESDEEIIILEDLISQGLDKAAAEMNIMRVQEGSHLATDLKERINSIEEHVYFVQQRAALRVPEARFKMQDRLKNLLEDENFDMNRLELEIAVLADRLDITEEIVRMGSHLKYFRQAIDAKEAVGRKLNFLIQEMNREVNTMGSKSNDAEVAHLVVSIKESLEIIREQIQNIE